MKTVKYRLEYAHYWFHAAMCWANAYIAYHQGNKVECAEYENRMFEWERKMHLLEFQKCVRS